MPAGKWGNRVGMGGGNEWHLWCRVDKLAQTYKPRLMPISRYDASRKVLEGGNRNEQWAQAILLNIQGLKLYNWKWGSLRRDRAEVHKVMHRPEQVDGVGPR